MKARYGRTEETQTGEKAERRGVGKEEQGKRRERKERETQGREGRVAQKQKQKWVWLLPRWALLAGPCLRGPSAATHRRLGHSGEEGSGL